MARDVLYGADERAALAFLEEHEAPLLLIGLDDLRIFDQISTVGSLGRVHMPPMILRAMDHPYALDVAQSLQAFRAVDPVAGRTQLAWRPEDVAVPIRAAAGAWGVSAATLRFEDGDRLYPRSHGARRPTHSVPKPSARPRA